MARPVLGSLLAVLFSLSAATAAQAAGADLKAGFAHSPRYPTVGEAVRFTDTSKGSPTSWRWDFGDGTSSTEQNPSHAFLIRGPKRVVLVVGDGTRSKKATRTVTVMPVVKAASFVFSPETPGPGELVQFADTTDGEPTARLWDFGDGSTSTAREPKYAFREEGVYVVTLSSTGRFGTKEVRRTVSVVSKGPLRVPVVAGPPRPVASFGFRPASPVAGQSVLFTDESEGNVASWSWDFADGTTGAGKEARHAFGKAGSFHVVLTVTNASGSDTAGEVVEVAPADALVADFAFTPAEPAAGEAVIFADTSVGTPDSWSWSFGDGGTSMIRFPVRKYARAGVYTITLTVKSDSNSSTVTKTVTVVD